MTERRERGIRVYASQFGIPEGEVVTYMTELLGVVFPRASMAIGIVRDELAKPG